MSLADLFGTDRTLSIMVCRYTFTHDLNIFWHMEALDANKVKMHLLHMQTVLCKHQNRTCNQAAALQVGRSKCWRVQGHHKSLPILALRYAALCSYYKPQSHHRVPATQHICWLQVLLHHSCLWPAQPSSCQEALGAWTLSQGTCSMNEPRRHWIRKLQIQRSDWDPYAIPKVAGRCRRTLSGLAMAW